MMLHFDRRYLKDIVSGRKRITIRYGHRYRVRPGNVLYLAVEGKPVARARLTEVTVKPLRKLTPHEIKMEGYKSFSALLRALRRHYPQITPGDYVTVLKWKLIR